MVSATGKRNKAADVTLSEATSPGENTINPFLIRMKEVPQMRVSAMSKKTAVKSFWSDIANAPKDWKKAIESKTDSC